MRKREPAPGPRVRARHDNGHRWQEANWQGPRLCFRGRVIATIVQDVRYPDMWRVRLPDGTLSDMVNLTRAKDAAMWLTGAQHG